jgi:hypothetical protein
MERVAVKSSLLASIGYDSVTKVLEVEFKNGPSRVYQYSEVTPEKYAEMMQAQSIGSFFLKEIKPSHVCKRIDGRDSDAIGKEQDSPARPQEDWPDKTDIT